MDDHVVCYDRMILHDLGRSMLMYPHLFKSCLSKSFMVPWVHGELDYPLQSSEVIRYESQGKLISFEQQPINLLSICLFPH